MGLAERLEKRRGALEQERVEREAELVEFQKRHFKEVSIVDCDSLPCS